MRGADSHRGSMQSPIKVESILHTGADHKDSALSLLEKEVRKLTKTDFALKLKILSQN